MNRLTCGQCESGPTAGMKKRKCVWSGDIRGQGALACKLHFASSAGSGLRCTKCKGPLGHYEASGGDDLCSRCVKSEMDKQEQRERVLCKFAGIAIVITGAAWLVGVGFQRGWW